MKNIKLTNLLLGIILIPSLLFANITYEDLGLNGNDRQIKVTHTTSTGTSEKIILINESTFGAKISDDKSTLTLSNITNEFINDYGAFNLYEGNKISN